MTSPVEENSKKIKLNKKPMDSNEENEADEEARLRARLLARQAEKVVEHKIKDEPSSSSSSAAQKKHEKEKHHHKKKKKRHDEPDESRDSKESSSVKPKPKISSIKSDLDTEKEKGPPASSQQPKTPPLEDTSMLKSVINAKITERITVVTPYLASTTVRSMAATSFLQEDEVEGLNIQPPQAIPAASSTKYQSHHKKHKKKEKRKSDEPAPPSHSKETQHESYEPTGKDDEFRKQRRINEGWAAWKSSLGSKGRPGGTSAIDESSRRAAQNIKTTSEQRADPISSSSRDKAKIEERQKSKPVEKVTRDSKRHRTDDLRRNRSRSPLDKKGGSHVISPPAPTHRSRRTSPGAGIKRKRSQSRSREPRWLPRLSSRERQQNAAPKDQSGAGRSGKSSSTNRDRDRRGAQKELAPSRSGSPSPAAPFSAETASKPIATPTQDELEDKEIDDGQPKAALSEVSKSEDGSRRSPKSSRSSSSGSYSRPDSLESGEHRSENGDFTHERNVASRGKYSKFESSPEEEVDGDQDVYSRSEGDYENKDVKNQQTEGLDSTENIVSDDENAEDNAELELDDEEMKTDDEPGLPIYYPATMGCRSVEEFQNLNKIEEGTYGVVYRAVEKRTGEIVALKRLKMEKEKEGFPITSLREINMLLKAGHHPNVVRVREIVVGSNMDKIYLVMDYVEHDLKSLMETMTHPFLAGEVKTLMLQLLAGVDYLHDNWILHRDLKTSNLLLSHKAVLKIGDFGLAREYGSPLKPYTPIVVTLWYRAPELLLGTKQYSTPIDIWSVGCILAELLTLKPLFAGKSEIEQLNKIFKMLGTPSNKIWPGYDELPGVKRMQFVEYPYNTLRKHFGANTLSDKGFSLLNMLLTYDPAKRITAADALKDGWFKEEPSPVPKSMFPTWPAKSELSRVVRKASPKPPSGGKQYKNSGDSDKDLLLGLSLQPGQLKASAGFSLKFDPHFR